MKKVMKHNQKHTLTIILAIIFSTLLFSCENNASTNPKKDNVNPNKDTINSNPIIGKTFKIDDLEIAEKDLPHKPPRYNDGGVEDDLNWDEAKKACAALGDGWRLPTKWELNRMYINADKIGSFNFNDDKFYNNRHYWYWSSTSFIDAIDGRRIMAWLQNFNTGIQQPGNTESFISLFEDNRGGHHARAVRNLYLQKNK